MSTHNIYFHEALLMSTYNICFHGEKERYQHFSDKKRALSVAMITIIRPNKKNKI